MAPRKNTTALPVAPVTEAETAVPAGVLAIAPADQSTESRLADITLAIHDKMRDYDKALTAYDKARGVMVKASVPVVRATVLLYMHAVNTGDKTLIAERGTNAGLPAVMKLASHLGYERRRFDRFYNAALAMIEADMEFPSTGADVTPAEIELVAPFFTKDAERKRAERANKGDKPATAPAGEADAEDEGESAGHPAVNPEAERVILADVLRALDEAHRLAEAYASGNGLTREAMDGIADKLADITATLENVVAE